MATMYLNFPMYVLLDLDMLSASMEITYSVHVVLRFRFAERRNFPFSTSKAANNISLNENIPQTCHDIHLQLKRQNTRKACNTAILV